MLGQNMMIAPPTTVPPAMPIVAAYPAAAAAAQVGTIDRSLDCRIYVGSLHYQLGQPEITALFSCFGNIAKFDLSHDAITGRSKGYAFIEYDNPTSAQAATAMDGFELANRKV